MRLMGAEAAIILRKIRKYLISRRAANENAYGGTATIGGPA